MSASSPSPSTDTKKEKTVISNEARARSKERKTKKKQDKESEDDKDDSDEIPDDSAATQTDKSPAKPKRDVTIKQQRRRQTTDEDDKKDADGDDDEGDGAYTPTFAFSCCKIHKFKRLSTSPETMSPRTSEGKKRTKPQQQQQQQQLPPTPPPMTVDHHAGDYGPLTTIALASATLLLYQAYISLLDWGLSSSPGYKALTASLVAIAFTVIVVLASREQLRPCRPSSDNKQQEQPRQHHLETAAQPSRRTGPVAVKPFEKEERGTGNSVSITVNRTRSTTGNTRSMLPAGGEAYD